MNSFLIISFAIFLIHNSSAQLPPQVTARKQQNYRHGHSSYNNQENDLSVNSIRSELNSFRIQIERVEQSNTQIVNALKNYRFDIDELKKSFNKVQAQCLENQIFGTPDHSQFISSDSKDLNNSTLNKLENLHQLVLTIKNSMQKIEREVIATRKSTRRSNSYAPVNHRGIFGYDHEIACTASNDIESGIKKLRKNFFIQCEHVENDGNWILIQSRETGDVNFFRNWNEYKEGFGNIGGEFWLGLEKIYELTSENLHELLITIEYFNGEKRSAKYSVFAISPEVNGYALSVLGKYSGDAGDALTYHAGMKFSTFDVDNDEWTDGSCAKSHQGGWWFRQCDESNLNGIYFSNDENPTKSNDNKGMYWKSSMITLKSVKMMIRPAE